MEAFYTCTRCTQKIPVSDVKCTECCTKRIRVKLVTLCGAERWDTINEARRDIEVIVCEPTYMARVFRARHDPFYSRDLPVFRRGFRYSHSESDQLGLYYVFLETWDPDLLEEMARAR